MRISTNEGLAGVIPTSIKVYLPNGDSDTASNISVISLALSL